MAVRFRVRTLVPGVHRVTFFVGDQAVDSRVTRGRRATVVADAERFRAVASGWAVTIAGALAEVSR
jgi:hypothetical protein